MLPGLVLAGAVALGIFALIYAGILVQTMSGDARVPGGAGPVAYALLHGGAAFVEVPPIPALFGIEGDLKLGLPLLSFAFLPFLAFLVGSRLMVRRLGSEAGSEAGSLVALPVVAALSYGLIVGVVALLGGIALDTSATDSISLSAAPISTAVWAALLALLGSALGVSVSQRSWLPVWARQAIRGVLWAVGVSLTAALLLLAVVALFSQGGGEGEAPVPQAPQELVPPEIFEAPPGAPAPAEGSGGGDGATTLAVVGAFFVLLPMALGNLWLVAHGLPMGVQNVPDLSQLPIVGPELANVPLSVSLLGEWPLGVEWRLLLAAPVVGLVVGGLVSARGASATNRWWRGALVAVPYTIVAFVVALAVGLSASISLMNVETSFALRASLPWLLLLLPAGAALGAIGSLLASGDADHPRPNLAFRTATGTSAVLLLGSLPLLAAPLAPSSSPGSEISQTPGSPPPTIVAPQPEESTQEGGAEDTEIVLSDTDPGDPPAGEFDDLLPILQDRTDAPIMLPADLPDQLENVAVDEDLEVEEYGILFQGEPTGNDLDTFVGANSVGTLTAEPAPGSNTDNEFFEATRTEGIELPDGTPATLSYMEPTGTPGNQGPYWEGKFERAGYVYNLMVEVADSPGEAAGRALSSMVLVDGTEESEEQVGSEEELRQAVEEYYLAAGAEEWDYTYEYLDSETRIMFTEEEWYRKNQYFADLDNTIYHILSVDLDETSEEPVAVVRLRLTGEDGSSRIRTTYFVWEDGAWRHRFGQEEIELFRPDLTYEEFVEAG